MNNENKDCIFCKIVNHEIPCFKIWEDKNFLAFFDINPNTLGQTLVISKKHYDSDMSNMNDEEYSEMMIAGKKVMNLLKEKLDVKRVGLVAEGMGVNHAHLKLYPMHGLSENPNFSEVENISLWFEKYPGFINTISGKTADFEKLKELQKKFIY